MHDNEELRGRSWSKLKKMKKSTRSEELKKRRKNAEEEEAKK